MQASSMESIRTVLANHGRPKELNEVEVRRVSFGTFAGTLNRLIVLQDRESQPMDTGDQGGGQN